MKLQGGKETSSEESKSSSFTASPRVSCACKGTAFASATTGTKAVRSFLPQLKYNKSTYRAELSSLD